MAHPAETLSTSDQGIGIDVPVVAFEKVSLAFDGNVILREVTFSVRAGRLMILLGGSGAGKSVILKLILGLLKPDSGVIRVNGERIDNMPELEMMKVRGDIGMLFQESALFDSLTVADNVGYRLYEETDMPAGQVRRRVEEILGFIGLEDSGGVSRSRAPWRRGRAFCCSTRRPPDSIPSRRRRLITRSSN